MKSKEQEEEEEEILKFKYIMCDDKDITVADPGGPRRPGPPAPKLSIHFALFGTILYKIRRISFPFQSWAPQPIGPPWPNPGSATVSIVV